MAGDTEDEIPESGAVFTFGKSKFADNIPSKFWLKNDVPLKVVCGDEHTALITENGKLFMFGSNNWGQLGLGDKSSVNKPTRVKALKPEKVKLVACGRTHTLVYTSRGNLYAAGGNNEGQLGLGDFKDRTSFEPVNFFPKCGPIKMLAAGSNTSAALMQDGKLYMWGDNTEGQIGLGNKEGTPVPQELSTGRRVAWMSCGYYHSAFVTEDGALFTFGEPDNGKLGLSTAQLPSHKVPQQVEGISEQVLQVACGGEHTVALTENCLYSFGLGQFGQLGHGTIVFESRVPRVVEHFRKGRVKHIACGENHTVVITDSGLLYTFGDGRHGKLALGEENFVNRFTPTLCPRFLKYNVHSVSCGGCHTLVLAKPRVEGPEAMTLEDDDGTVVYLEKSNTELLMEVDSRPNLKRSLSARDRRRERERSPEQYGMMFRTLPPLSSRNLGVSLPMSSHTLPSRIPHTELHSNNAPNGLTGNVTTECEVDGKRSVEKYEDNESVKDLGETTDLLNVTHVINMDTGEKTLTLSPVHKKKVKVGKKCSQEMEQPARDPGWAKHTSSKDLSADLPRSRSGKSPHRESRLARIRYHIAQSSSSDKENAEMESRLTRCKTRSSRAKQESQSESVTEPEPGLSIHAARESQFLQLVSKITGDTKRPKGKDKSSRESLSNPKFIYICLVEVKACKSQGKTKRLRRNDSGKTGSSVHRMSEAKRQIIDVKDRINPEENNHKQILLNSKTLADQSVPKDVAAKITQVQHTAGETERKVAKATSTSAIKQSKLKDNTLETDAKCSSKKHLKQHTLEKTMTPTNTNITERHLMDAKSIDCMESKSDFQSEATDPSSPLEVISLTEKLRMESPASLPKEGVTRKSLSRATTVNSSQTSLCRQSPNKLSDWNLSDAIPISSQGQSSKRTVVTINVMPEGSEDRDGERGKGEISQLSEEEEDKDRTRGTIMKSGKEGGKTVEDGDEQEDDATLRESSEDEAEGNEPEMEVSSHETCKMRQKDEDAEEETDARTESESGKLESESEEERDKESLKPKSDSEVEDNSRKDKGIEANSSEEEKGSERSMADSEEGDKEEHGTQNEGEDSTTGEEEESETAEDESETSGHKSSTKNESETAGQESDTAEDKSEKGGQESDTAEDESEEGGQESDTAEDESEKGGQESDTAEDESEEGGQESDTAEGESEEGGQESDTAEGESEEGGQESDTAEGESEEGGQESDTAEDESEEGGQESDTAEDESEEGGQESDTAEDESEEGGQESATAEDESEEGGQESATAEDESEEGGQESATAEDESEEGGQESNTAEDESEEGGQESDTAEDESEEGVQESDTAGGESEEGGQESDTAGGESEEGGQDSKAGDEESEGEGDEEGSEAEEESGEMEDEGEEEEADEEENESDDSEPEEEEEHENQEEEESEDVNEENDDGGENKEAKSEEQAGEEEENEEDNDQEEAVKEEEVESEEGESEVAEEEEDEANKKQKESKRASKSSQEMVKDRKPRKSLAEKRQFKPQEPQQFWDDVLPHYLNLK